MQSKDIGFIMELTDEEKHNIKLLLSKCYMSISDDLDHSRIITIEEVIERLAEAGSEILEKYTNLFDE